MKVAMKIAYSGANFCGFQEQKKSSNMASNSIAGALREALESVGIFSPFVASGRTDKGVNATAQVISLEIPPFYQDLEKLKKHLNPKLAPLIQIKAIWEVPSHFNARFSAKRRSYCYVLTTHNTPFLAHCALFYNLKNPQILKQALNLFVGEHNFKAFMKKGGSGDKSGSIRKIYRARLIKKGKFWIFNFCGNGFLRSQIRLMVGFLLEIDKENLILEDLKRQLEGEFIFRIPAPAYGLFLTNVKYSK
ncbi:MAG: tRNA pseudouridine(38-40) synthase TruA [Helicobacter sp.]|nr:tRNA pseudouridine(38-40) synthase TruA [Helicobacter sp.]